SLVHYRLSLFPVELPPLRKRTEDIALLADHFVQASARKVGRPKPRLTLANVQRLQQYDWPANVPEVQDVLERAVITVIGGKLTIDLPIAPSAGRGTVVVGDETAVLRTDAEMRQLEADNLRAALKAANGKFPGRAARRSCWG